MNKHKLINGIIKKDGSGKDKYLCCHCLISGKGSHPCGIQGHTILRASHKIHFPSPKDNKKKWIKTMADVGWIDYFNKYKNILNNPNNSLNEQHTLERIEKMQILFKTIGINL